jgi:hypothetical protein
MGHVAKLIVAVVLALCLPAQAHFLRGGGSTTTPPPTYTDLCSQSGVSCVYGYSTAHRVAAGATKAFQLTKFSNGATLDIGFVGPNYLTDTAAAAAFGCTISTEWLTVTPTCGYSIIYDQEYESTHGGSTGGCDVAQATQSQMPLYSIWAPWGRPVAISTDNKVSSSVAHWLTKTGCTAISSVAGGSGPRSIIVLGNNGYPSTCCGVQGLTEDVASAVTGTMWSWSYYQDLAAGTGTQIAYGPDLEGGGTGSVDANTAQTSDLIGVSTWSGDSGTHTANSWSNGNLNYTISAPAIGKHCNGNTTYLCTQSRMNIGCDGDQLYCGPLFFATMVITSNDVTSVEPAVTSYLQTAKATFSPTIGIGGIQLLNTTVAASVPNALVGYPTAFMLQNGGMFTGTLALVTSGNDYFGNACGATDLQLISTGGGNYELEANGSTGESLGTHSLCIGATESGAVNSPYVLPFTVTATAASTTVGSVSAYNNSGSTTPGSTFPYHLFKAFKQGDVPAGNTISQVTVGGSAIQFGMGCAFGAPPTSQQKCPTWPDLSLRGAMFSVFLPQMANQAVDDIVFSTAAGTSDNSTTVTPATITANYPYLRVALNLVNNSWIPTRALPNGVSIGCYVVGGSVPTGSGGCVLRSVPPTTSNGTSAGVTCSDTTTGNCNATIYGGLWNGTTPINGNSVDSAGLTATVGANNFPTSISVSSGGSGYLTVGSGAMTLDTSVVLNEYGSIQPPTCSEEEGAGTFSSATYSGGSLTPTVTAGHIARLQVVTDSTGAAAVVTGGVSWIGGIALPLNGLFMPTQGNAGHYTFKVTTAGVAGATIPTSWNQTVSGTTADGTAVWTNEGTSVAWPVSAALTNGAMAAQTPLCVDEVNPTMIEYEGFAPYLDNSTSVADPSERGYFWIRLWKQAGTPYSIQAGAYTSHYPFTAGVFAPSYTYDADLFSGTAEFRGNAISGPNYYTRITDRWPAGWWTNDPCLTGGIGCSGQMDWLGVTPNSATFYTANSEVLNGVIPTLTSTDKLYDAHLWLPFDETITPSPLIIPATTPGGHWDSPLQWQGYYFPYGPNFLNDQSIFDGGGDHNFLGVFGNAFPSWEVVTTQASDHGASYYQQMMVNALGLSGAISGILSDPTGHQIDIDPTFYNAANTDGYQSNANLGLPIAFAGYGPPAVGGGGAGNWYVGTGDTSHFPSPAPILPYLLNGNRFELKLADWTAGSEGLTNYDTQSRTVIFGANTCYNADWNDPSGGPRQAAWQLVLYSQAAVLGNPNEPDTQYWQHELTMWNHCTAQLYPFVGTVTYGVPTYATWTKNYDYSGLGAKEASNPTAFAPGRTPAWIPFMDGYYEMELNREKLWYGSSDADVNAMYNIIVINGAVNRATENDCTFNFGNYGATFATGLPGLAPNASWDSTHIATAGTGTFQLAAGPGGEYTLASTSGSTIFTVSNTQPTGASFGTYIPSGSLVRPLNYDPVAQGTYGVLPPTPLLEQRYIWCTITQSNTGPVSGTINPVGTTCPGNSSTWIVATQTVPAFEADWVYNLSNCPSPQSGEWHEIGFEPYYAIEGYAAAVWDAYVRRPDMNNTTAVTGLHEAMPNLSGAPRWAARSH